MGRPQGDVCALESPLRIPNVRRRANALGEAWPLGPTSGGGSSVRWPVS